MGSGNMLEKKQVVAHFMPWSGIGGVEIATLRLVEATRDKFHHVAFCLDDAVALQEAFTRLGIATVPYVPPTPSLRHAGKYYKESLAVKRLLQAVGADIVHFADEKAASHNSLAAMMAGTKNICHIRVSYPRLSIRQRLCLLPVHHFIFVSKEAMTTFAIPLSKKKARVIYDAVEIPEMDMADCSAGVRLELGIKRKTAVVGIVARVSAQKDYFTLSLAAAEVLRRLPDTLFLVVGDNALVPLNRQHYADVMEKLNELGIADRFIFTGHRSDVSRMMSAMDVCVLCTHREGFPLSILESMAMGKPVIATAVGGIPEIVEPGVTGYLHPHENDKELADHIISLLEDPVKANQMGQCAREHVVQNYSRKKFIEEISKAYRDVATVRLRFRSPDRLEV